MTLDLANTFWQEYIYLLKEKGQSIPDKYEAWYFCNNETSANSLAKLVYSGKKTATASLFWLYEFESSPTPRAGDHSIITLWDGSPVCIIETVDCQVIPFDQVPASFAFDEGEGDRSLEYWREVHLEFFYEECEKIGKFITPSMPVVCEHFRVVHRKDGVFSN